MATLLEILTYQPQELKFGTSGLRALVTEMTDLECYINTAGFLGFLVGIKHLKPGDVVYVAGDLRDSTPRIMKAVHQAILDNGYKTVYCGLIPTPAVALYGLQHQAPCIMVTGSHIPEDRNGIKFYKADGEVLKADEDAIKQAVAKVRAMQYYLPADQSPFSKDGMLKQASQLPQEDGAATVAYSERYTSVFGRQAFKGKKIVFYQHSAVGRDLLIQLLRDLGAEVVPVGRADHFIPIDTENVTPENRAYFTQLATEHPDAFAIVSTDGDSDRPFVIDEQGVFHRGDELGAVVADWLQADFAAFPVSASDAVDQYLTQKHIDLTHTKIGSPYVVVAMQQAIETGKQRAVGWEVNGGFMVGQNMNVNNAPLEALPTRDAILPIIVALQRAIDMQSAVSASFSELPQRFTSAGLINNFPVQTSAQIMKTFAEDSPQTHQQLKKYFTAEQGFAEITKIVSLDGVRIFFDNGDIAHMRPSGNAPQLRMYSVADSEARAEEIVALAIAEPEGIFRRIEKDLATGL